MSVEWITTIESTDVEIFVFISKIRLKVAVTCRLPCLCCLVFWVYNRHTFSVQNMKKSWLATKPSCSLVDNASLGPQLPPSSSGCPRLPITGGGWGSPQTASSAQSFVLWAGLAVSWVRAFHGVAIPQSGLLSQVSSLRLPLGHSGLVLTLSNAAPASLSRPCLLVVDACVCTASPLGVTVGHVICGF